MWLVVTEIRSESFGLITERRQYITTHVIFYRRVWYDRALSLRYMCIRSLGIILIPLGYLCAKFRFFRGLRCWAKKSRHSLTQSLSHSINHSPNLLMRREPKLWLRNTCCHSASNVSFIFDQYPFFHKPNRCLVQILLFSHSPASLYLPIPWQENVETFSTYSGHARGVVKAHRLSHATPFLNLFTGF